MDMLEIRTGNQPTMGEAKDLFRSKYKELLPNLNAIGIEMTVSDKEEKVKLLVGYDERGEAIYEYYSLSNSDYRRCCRRLATMEEQAVEDEIATYHLRQRIKAEKKELEACQAAEQEEKRLAAQGLGDGFVTEEYFLPSGVMSLSWMIDKHGDFIFPDYAYDSLQSEGTLVKIWNYIPEGAIVAMVGVESSGCSMRYKLTANSMEDGETHEVMATNEDSEDAMECARKEASQHLHITNAQRAILARLQMDLLRRIYGQFGDDVLPQIIPEGWLKLQNNCDYANKMIIELQEYARDLQVERNRLEEKNAKDSN